MVDSQIFLSKKINHKNVIQTILHLLFILSIKLGLNSLVHPDFTKFLNKIHYIFLSVNVTNNISTVKLLVFNQLSHRHYYQFHTMLSGNTKIENYLRIRAVTWLKDSHSLFDYQFNNNVSQEAFDLSLNDKFVFLYRNNETAQINVRQKQKMIPSFISKDLQLLGCFELSLDSNKKKWYLTFHDASEFQGSKKIQQAITSNEDEQDSPVKVSSQSQDIYLIVRSLKDKNNQNKGYKLKNGQFLKVGRIQFKVSTIDSKKMINAETVGEDFKQCQKIDPNLENCCRYCLDEETQEGNFLINPCKCSGSTGLVHIKCLEQWILSKVKREIVGGTVQYNFDKYSCELCKTEFPRFIKKQNNYYELMQIEKPQDSHIMLQGLSEKTKNLIVVQQIPQDGIKIGRSHQCEIKISDISISRSHALIEKINGDFYVFDNKSKFGTLVREKNIHLQLNKIKQGVQIGRTVMTFQLVKKQETY